jgi:hypothetical protein
MFGIDRARNVAGEPLRLFAAMARQAAGRHGPAKQWFVAFNNHLFYPFEHEAQKST